MIKYRKATCSDAENLLKARYHAVVNCESTRYPKEILEAWAPKINDDTIAAESKSLNNPDRITFVAEDCSDEQTKIAGFTTLVVSSGSVWQCYVLPEYGKQGIAKKLMDMLEDAARENGIKKLTVSSSLMALEFQKKRGYIPLNSYEYDLGDDLSLTCYMMEKKLE